MSRDTPDNTFRAVFVSIEGGDEKAIKAVIQGLSEHNAFNTVSSLKYSESTSEIGTLLYRDDYDSIDLSNVVHYQLRNANMWEVQGELKSYLTDKIIVLTGSYVLSNRARLISSGIVGPDFCYQLDEGLIKPDLQIHLQSNPVPLSNRISVSAKDTFESRSQIVEAFKRLSQNEQEVKTIIHQSDDDLNLCIEQARQIFDKICDPKYAFKDFQYFKGYV